MEDIMKSLTKTELKWMYSAMENEVKMLNEYIDGIEENSITTIAKHKIETLKATMAKIENILTSGTKRIEIK